MTHIESTETALRLAIVRRAFTVCRRGYDTTEVDELLDSISRLADDLMVEAAAASRHLAEAEAELVGARAELRELREAAAASESLLVATRAELGAERRRNAGEGEAEERLVVAEAEVRLLRASAEQSDRALEDARELLGLEQAARGAVETQLHDVSEQLAALADAPPSDPFAEVGAEVAAVLHAAAAAAEEMRERARRQAAAVVAEAEEVADSLLEEAEARAAAAEARARAVSVLEDAAGG
ncbi:MAG TPA: DivIVA domain-containing protein [Acidimicrobiales bacterium]|nr:DivIVA domain-containing protein [Acidimicrobiales bacterium]